MRGAAASRGPDGTSPEEVLAMKDGRTRKVATQAGGGKGFLDTHSATIVFASGPMAGSEFALDQERVTLGRGTGADVVIQDASISHLHAALELGAKGFRLRDLGSTNGVTVNGAKVELAELKHGDRFQLGAVTFRYVVESRAAAPPTHELRGE
jgi:pSer/pThr/pTyr-binding forkhead associated (FHA) protein